MTKKDYITIANALKPFYKDLHLTIEQSRLLVKIITALSQVMSKDNPRFNPVRFLDMIRGAQQ